MAATSKRRLKPAKYVVFIAALCGLAAALPLVIATRHEPSPDRAMAFPRGEIVVGVDASVPPFAYDDGRSITGLDIDLAASVAETTGMPIRFMNIGYYGLYDALISGEVDMLVSALRVMPLRMDDVRYTQHYFDNGLLLVSSADDAVTSIDAAAGLGIAYELGSPADAELRKLERRIGQVQPFPYELPQYALDALRLGAADAALVDATTLALYRRNHPDWATIEFFVTQELYVIALPIDRPDAWRLVDAALTALKESGQLATIIAKWM